LPGRGKPAIPNAFTPTGDADRPLHLEPDGRASGSQAVRQACAVRYRTAQMIALAYATSM